MRPDALISSPVRRLWPPFLVLGAALAAGGASAGAPQEAPPTFPAGVELITIDAVVLDAEGHPVRGLTRDDFVVREEGRSREIESFEAVALESEPAEPPSPAAAPEVVVTNTAPPADSGRAFALIVDDLGISAPETPLVRQAVRAFVEDALVDGDEVTLGSTSGSLWWSARIPEGRDDVLEVLDRAQGRYVDQAQTESMTEYEAFWINNREAGGLIPNNTADMAGARSVRERVIRRWLSRGLCGNSTHGAVANCYPMVQASAAAIDGARRERHRLMLEAVRRGMEALEPVRGRTSLLLFSPGFVEDSDLPLEPVRAVSRETHTAVYFIDTRSLMTDAGLGQADVMDQFGEPGEQSRMRFEQRNLSSVGAQGLADDTGGFSVRNTNDLASGARRVAEESRVFYLLGFRPSGEGSADAWRRLEVQVKTPGLKVRARRGFTLRAAEPVPSPASGRRKAGPGEESREPGERVRAALDSAVPLSGIPLRAMVYTLEPRSNGSTHVLVAVELDARQLAVRAQGAQRTADLEVGITATHRDTGRGFLHSEDIAMTVGASEALGWRGLVREFELGTGVHQARVVVRDRSSGRMGAVTQRFDVPFPGELRVSTPILTDRLVPASGPQQRPQPALAAHRSFLDSGALYCQFEVFGAARDRRTGAPRVTAGLEIRGRGHRVVRAVEPTPIEPGADGRLVRLMGMGLGGMEDGPYELVLKVRDEVKDALVEDRQPFTVTGDRP